MTSQPGIAARETVLADADTRGMTLRLRVFGRICFVVEGGGQTGTTFQQLRVIGVRMEKNPELGLDPHFMRLTAPLSCISAHTKRPDDTSFSSDSNGEDIEEYYIWDLTDCDVSISGLQDGGGVVASDTTQRFAELNAHLPPQRAKLAPTVRDEAVSSAASCVLTLNTGTLRPFSPLGPRPVRFAPLGDDTPDPRSPATSIADGGEIILPATGSQVIVNITKRTGAREAFSITLEKDAIVNGLNPIVTLSNTCGCSVNDTAVPRDTEFAAYYELLEDPGVPAERPIPFIAEQRVSSGGCDVPGFLQL